MAGEEFDELMVLAAVLVIARFGESRDLC